MADLYKVVNGKRVKLTAAQKTAREVEELASQPSADDYKEQAEQLYKELKAKRLITVDGIEYDLSDSFEFDYQRKKGGNVRLKPSKGKTESKTKAQTGSIETALFTYINSVADAFDSDMTDIEAGVYTLANLKALK